MSSADDLQPVQPPASAPYASQVTVQENSDAMVPAVAESENRSDSQQSAGSSLPSVWELSSVPSEDTPKPTLSPPMKQNDEQPSSRARRITRNDTDPKVEELQALGEL